jgi:hypothetical protein
MPLSTPYKMIPDATAVLEPSPLMGKFSFPPSSVLRAAVVMGLWAMWAMWAMLVAGCPSLRPLVRVEDGHVICLYK